jgi:hypothetical protein
MNMCWTMDYPGQAGKLIRGIGWRELKLSRNSTGQTLEACTQMWIQQRATACASRWFDLARSETWTKDCPRHARDQQQTLQELAVGAVRWARRTWVSGSYRYPRSWDHGGWPRVALNPLRSWGIMGKNFQLLGR